MSERVDTLYHRVKAHLAGRPNVETLGELVDFEQNPYLTEKISFVVAPKPDIGFDPEKLREFMESIEMKEEHSLMMYPGLSLKQLEDNTTVDIFHHGLIHYTERLKEFEDLLYPLKYLKYLADTQSQPKLHPSSSTRSINITVYPTRSYANQIYIYNSGSSRRNPTMDYLNHSISQEQLDALLENRLDILRNLPQPPRFARLTGR